MAKNQAEEEGAGEVLDGFTVVIKYEVFRDEDKLTGVYGQFKEHIDMPLEDAVRNPEQFKAARRQLSVLMGEALRKAARGHRAWKKAGRVSEAKLKDD